MSVRALLLSSLLACVIVTHLIAAGILLYTTSYSPVESYKDLIIIDNQTSLEQVAVSNDINSMPSRISSPSSSEARKVRVAVDENGNIIAHSLHHALANNSSTSSTVSNLIENWLKVHFPTVYNHQAIDTIKKNEPYHKAALAFFISFIICTLLTIWFSKYISSPIRLLSSMANSIERRRFADIPKQAYRYKEVSVIATQLAALKNTLNKQESSINYQKKHDKLTSLYNYQAAIEAIELCLHREDPFNIIRLSLDDFRSIKGTFGYTIGDQILITTASRLRELATANRLPFRLYNNEFLILSYGEEINKTWLSLLFETLSTPISLHSTASVRPTFTLGVANYPVDGNVAQLLLRRSDIAINEAYKNGIKYKRYTDEIEQHNLRKTIIINDLPSAIANHELWMDYQPKVDIATGEVKHFEALVRWRHATLGLIFPDEFIELAEQMGFIRQLSYWVMTHVCQQLHLWKQNGHLLSVAINLSANDINDLTLPSHIEKLLSDYELMPWQLSLEITESAAMKDMDTAITVLNKISSLGITLAIDDFGTGYSSLLQLKQLPVNELKIDKSFVLDLNTESSNLPIVSSTIELGHALGLTIIAEGVENAESAETLAALGCHFLQGYWISKPMPAHQVITWLSKFEKLIFKNQYLKTNT